MMIFFPVSVRLKKSEGRAASCADPRYVAGFPTESLSQLEIIQRPPSALPSHSEAFGIFRA